MLLPAFQSPEWRVVVLSLYRRILRLHEAKLLSHQKALGDSYVKQEFRLSTTASKEHSHEFVKGWLAYEQQLRDVSDPRLVGRDLDEDVSMTDEQKEQLLKLKEEAEELVQSMYAAPESENESEMSDLEREIAELADKLGDKGKHL